jgi:hypothetical protein
VATTVTLRQEKILIGAAGAESYNVVSEIIAAAPTSMFPLFVVSEGVDAQDEQFQRVAKLEDFDSYVENPLTKLVAPTSGGFTGVVAGDTLTIPFAASSVPEWFTTNFTAASFAIESVDASGDFLLIEPVTPFPTAAAGLQWNITGAAPASGSNAKTARSLAATTFLRRHWTSELNNIQKAESRFEAIRAHVEAIIKDANTYGVTFKGVSTEIYA